MPSDVEMGEEGRGIQKVFRNWPRYHSSAFFPIQAFHPQKSMQWPPFQMSDSPYLGCFLYPVSKALSFLLEEPKTLLLDIVSKLVVVIRLISSKWDKHQQVRTVIPDRYMFLLLEQASDPS